MQGDWQGVSRPGNARQGAGGQRRSPGQELLENSHGATGTGPALPLDQNPYFYSFNWFYKGIRTVPTNSFNISQPAQF